MSKVLIICSTGVSSNAYKKALQQGVQEMGLPIEVVAIGIADCEEYIGKVDAIVLSPQVRFNQQKITTMFQTVPVYCVSTKDYAQSSVTSILDILKAN